MKTSNEKRLNIIKSLQETKEKRRTQRCFVLELKIDYSKLNKKQKEILKMFFVEAKWLYNYYLSQEDIFKQSDKIKKVIVKDKDMNDIEREIKYLPSKVKQSLLQQLKQNIVNLSKSKKKGNTIGKLKFKKEINSLDFNQYENTHKIIDKNKIKLAGIKKYIQVNGLNQVHKDYEIANAKLVKKPSGYYIKLSCFKNLVMKNLNHIENKKGDLGIDFGIKDNIVTSNGEFFNVKVQESESLKSLQRKLARQNKGSKNFYKTVIKIRKAYEKLSNIKLDKANKIVNYICKNHNQVFIQDENIKGWQKGLFGKQMQHSALGTIKSKLISQKNVIVLDRFEPTTKLCHHCGSLNKDIKLSDRIFKCKCGYKEHRDIKSAKTILYLGLIKTNYIPTEHRESKLVEKQSSELIELDSINLSHTSMKQEAKGL